MDLVDFFEKLTEKNDKGIQLSTCKIYASPQFSTDLVNRGIAGTSRPRNKVVRKRKTGEEKIGKKYVGI